MKYQIKAKNTIIDPIEFTPKRFIINIQFLKIKFFLLEFFAVPIGEKYAGGRIRTDEPTKGIGLEPRHHQISAQ